VRRSDPGDPVKCPVWQFHLVYSDDSTANGTARLQERGNWLPGLQITHHDKILAEQAPMYERIMKYEKILPWCATSLQTAVRKPTSCGRNHARHPRTMGLSYS